MLNLPPPPMPQLAPAVAWGATAAAIATGAAILLWGRIIHRALLVVIGFFAGVFAGGAIALQIGLNPIIGQAVGAFVLAIVGLVCARVIWAVLVAATAGAVAATILLAYRPLGAAPESATAWADWLWMAARHCATGLRGAFDQSPTMVLLTLVPACLGPLIIALLCDRLARIIATSLAGGTLLVGGAILAMSQIRPTWWQSICTYWYIPLAAAGVLTATGAVLQYPAALAADRDRAKEQVKPTDKDKSKNT